MSTIGTEPVREGAVPVRWSRWLVALVIPVGPAAIALLRFVLPYETLDDPAALIASVSADLDAQSLVLWLAFVATLTLVPGTWWVGRLTRRRAPRVTATALALLVPSYLVLIWLISMDLLVWTGAAAGVEDVALVRLFETVHPTTDVAAGIYVIGHIVGTVLLGTAMWRSGAVPRWAALATIVSQPLHFVAAVIVGSPTLDLVAWGMQAAGYAAAAVAIVRLADSEW